MSDIGLIRVRRQCIEHKTAIKLQLGLLNETDGRPAVDMQPAGDEGFLHLDGGILWLATLGGIASLHPSDFGYQANSRHTIWKSTRPINQAECQALALLRYALGHRPSLMRSRMKLLCETTIFRWSTAESSAR